MNLESAVPKILLQTARLIAKPAAIMMTDGNALTHLKAPPSGSWTPMAASVQRWK